MDSPTRYAGVDWARRAHAVCIVDEHGTATERFEVEHSGQGLRMLGRRLAGAGVGRVAIERPDGPVIDALFTAGLAAWLSPKRMAAWLASEGYCGRTNPEELCRRLEAAPLGVTGPEAEARAAVTLAFVRALIAVRDQVAELEARIREQLELHPDGTIFRSLPRAGQVRAAALLAEIGDVRERFPTPESLACLAGAAPSTRQSGQHLAVTFRFACDKKLRDALIDFAEDSRLANPWAADVYQRARGRRKTHPHAGRILARAWVYVIWRCWQDRVPYDPARHRALQQVVLAKAA